MDDVADVHGGDAARFVVHDQLARIADADRPPHDVARGSLDAYTAAERREPALVLALHVLQAWVPGAQLVQEPREQFAPVDVVARLEAARGCGLGEVGRELVPIHVDTYADDDCAAVRLGKYPRKLAVADDEVVRPLQRGGEPGDAFDRVGHRHSGGHRDELGAFRRERRSQQDRHKERRLRRRHPVPAAPAATGGLLICDCHEALACVPARFVEQVTVCRVERVEPPDFVKPGESRHRNGVVLRHRP